MKLKKFFTSIDFKYLILVLLLTILSLPLIFPEDEQLVSYLPKEIFLQKDESLPVYPKIDAPQADRKLKDIDKLKEVPEIPTQVIQKIKENIKKSNPKPAITQDFLFMDEEEFTPSYDTTENHQNEGNSTRSYYDTALTKRNTGVSSQTNIYNNNNNPDSNSSYTHTQNTSKDGNEKTPTRYHNISEGLKSKSDINTKNQKDEITPFPNNSRDNISMPSAENIDYKPFPANFSEAIKNFLKAANFKNDVKAYERSNMNRDNWPNGYYDDYNLELFNMGSIHNSLMDGVKNATSHSFLNTDTSSNKDYTGSSKPAENFVHQMTSENTSKNNTAMPSEKNIKSSENTNPVFAIGNTDLYSDNFAENYSLGIQHNIGCNSSALFTREEIRNYDIHKQIKEQNISLPFGACPSSFDVSVIQVQDAIEKRDLANLHNRIQEMASKSNKTTIQIVSADRTIYPMVQELNTGNSIVNSKGRPVKIEAIGPRENEKNLANALQEITSTLIANGEDAEKLNNILNDFYRVSQLKQMNTMLAFPDENDNDLVFVLNDPNNSYWLKNPEQITKYPKANLTQNGVTYQGFSVSKKQIKDILQEKRTNFIYVSGNEDNLVLFNGSVVRDIKEGDYSISSLDPIDIERNVNLVGETTKLGFKASHS